MTDTDNLPETSAEVAAEATAVDTTFAEPVVEPTPIVDPPLLDEGPATPADRSDLLFTIAEKAKIRANIRWIMTEIDYARSGRRADERETLNP